MNPFLLIFILIRVFVLASILRHDDDRPHAGYVDKNQAFNSFSVGAAIDISLMVLAIGWAVGHA